MYHGYQIKLKNYLYYSEYFSFIFSSFAKIGVGGLEKQEMKEQWP